MANRTCISLELGHTTLTRDRTFDHDELSRSCKLANRLRTCVVPATLSVVTTLLIDDKKIDARIRERRGGELTAYLQRFAEIDYYCYERDLVAYVEPMLACLTPRVRKTQREAIDRRRRNGYETLACSVDVTIWHLLRLGILEDTEHVLRPLNADRPYSGSEVTVSVLPDYLGDPEEKAAKRILKHLHGHPNVRNRVFPVFFPVDGLANQFAMRQVERRIDGVATMILDALPRERIRVEGFAVPMLTGT
jgi:hypothetical protein